MGGKNGLLVVMVLLVLISSALTYIVTKRYNGPADFLRQMRSIFSRPGARGVPRRPQQQMGYSDLAEPINP